MIKKCFFCASNYHILKWFRNSNSSPFSLHSRQPPTSPPFVHHICFFASQKLMASLLSLFIKASKCPIYTLRNWIDVCIVNYTDLKVISSYLTFVGFWFIILYSYGHSLMQKFVVAMKYLPSFFISHKNRTWKRFNQSAYLPLVICARI